jgi:tRNA threonylcarbamoyladenosine biosynthesis protein TsaB
VSDERWILGFDASTPRCVIALGRVGPGDRQTLVVADQHSDPGGNQASVHLIPRLQSVIERAGITAADLHAIACGCGPGTFTGTRVAVSTAKGLCFGLRCPLVPVSTLAALALSAEQSGWLLPLLDARRDEAYGLPIRVTRYTEDRIVEMHAAAEPSCAPASALVAAALREAGEAGVLAIGPGVEPYRSALPGSMQDRAIVLPGPSAVGLWAACAHAWRAGLAVDPADAEPIYLRKSYAELGVNKPKRPVSRNPFV